MARYDRETKHYDRNVLAAMVADGAATYFEAADVYVVKTEEGTFAVRPHQIIDTALITVLTSDRYQPITDVEVITAPSPMDGYSGQEQYDGEDTGPGGVVYDSMLAIAEKFLGDNPEGIDPLEIVRRMLDNESYAQLITDEANGIPITPCDQSRRAFARRQNEQDDLLKHFGV